MNHKEIMAELTPRARRSVAQRIRRITEKWAKCQISAQEMMIQEQKIFNELERLITETKRR